MYWKQSLHNSSMLSTAHASSNEYQHHSNVYRAFSNDVGKQDGLHGDYMEREYLHLHRMLSHEYISWLKQYLLAG